MVHALQNSTRIVLLTGAGVSADSGVPHFRDAQTGLWEKFKPEDHSESPLPLTGPAGQVLPGLLHALK